MPLPTGPGESSKNSVFVDTGAKSVAAIPILPIRDTIKGGKEPAFDLIDEALYHFRTNIFMRDFQIKSDADRLLIYLTFYGMKCLKLFAKKSKAESAKEIEGWNLKDFPVPGDGGFILAALVTQPNSPQEKNELKDFLKKCRIELGNRLLAIVYGSETKADKWWACFGGRKFMDKEMAN
jgi:actin related protein 2/3 complex subunit 3